MAKAFIVDDPYRGIKTTLTEFAKSEGVPRHAVSHFYMLHRTLQGFRDRPAKGTGNGIKAHTYTRNGAFLSIKEAQRLSGIDYGTLLRYKKIYNTTDIDEIKHLYDNAREQRIVLVETEDGRKVDKKTFANEVGTSINAVSCWLSRKGSINGFLKRGHSRSNPKLYLHSGLGVSKSMKDWTLYFKCSLSAVKHWLYHNHLDMNGFAVHNRQREAIKATIKGRRRTLKDWAKIFGVSYARVYKHFHRHGTLEGFDPKRKQGRPVQVASA